MPQWSRGIAPLFRGEFAEAFSLTPGRMATVSLKNVMKIYPHSGDEKKKKKAKKGDAPEKKSNLQITDRGVVARSEEHTSELQSHLT